MSESDNQQERPRALQLPTPRNLAPQESYRPTPHHAGFTGSGTIKFVVNGEDGIRLSDASEGNWVGFEGRDDRTLFEGERLQIIIRLHVSHPISVRHQLCCLILAPSSSGVRPGNQR